MVVRKLLRSPAGLFGLAVTLVFVMSALFAPWLAPRDPFRQDLRARLQPPGAEGHLLGSDHLGRDTMSRLLHGARVSLIVGAVAVAFGIGVGVPAGMIAGYFGGTVDAVLMRIADILLALPRVLVAIIITATFGLQFWTLVVAVGFPDIPIFARLVRSSTLSLARSEFATASRSLGASSGRVIFRHILPNLVAPIVVQASFSMATVILITGSLSFLGLGVQPPTPEWGAMIAQGREYIRTHPHLIMIPGIALAVVIMGFNFLGDATLQALDPRFRRR